MNKLARIMDMAIAVFFLPKVNKSISIDGMNINWYNLNFFINTPKKTMLYAAIA